MRWVYYVLPTIGIVLIAAIIVWLIPLPSVDEPTTPQDLITQTATDQNNASENTVVNNNTTVITNQNNQNISETNETIEPLTTDNADAHSCDQDAITFCQGTPPGKINLVNCLLDDHYNDISAACRESLERRQQLNEELVDACEVDRATFCKGVEPKVGSEPMVDCLEEHYDQLTPTCAAAWDAHEAAKPTQ